MILLLLACDLGGAPAPGDTAEILYDVPKGATARGIGPDLAEKGLVSAAWKWEWRLRLGADGSCLKAGLHRVWRGMDADTLLEALCANPVPADEPFTVVEGWRIREIDAALAARGWIQAGEYAASAADVAAFHAAFPLPTGTLEGYLFPETYMVTPDRFTAKGFIQRQLDLLGERFYTPHAGEFGTRSFADVVTMASMIEREEPTPANRPLIAGILWKRVDAGWNLGVDATSRYTLEDWNDRATFMGKLRDPTDPWNTRLRPGLPKTPIGNPGLVALEAALKPEPSEYWYYLHDATKTLHPARNVAEHEAFRRKFGVY
jgi:UPF0755 protein